MKQNDAAFWGEKPASSNGSVYKQLNKLRRGSVSSRRSTSSVNDFIKAIRNPNEGE